MTAPAEAARMADVRAWGDDVTPDAGRKSVDAAAVTALSEMVTANRNWSDYAWREAALGLVTSSRPLAPAPGAVDAAEAAEMVDGFAGLVCTTQADDFYLRPKADQHHYRDREMAARRALIAALTATPAPAPDAAGENGGGA